MKFLQKAFNKHLVNKIIALGHKPASKPGDEQSRLKDLKDLKIIEESIDKSKRFSSFPKLAATLTECDKAAINIIDDTTQHCKINFGMDMVENVMTKEVPRELSVCAHVLNNASEPLVINDLTKDDRTKHVFKLNNPLINQTFEWLTILDSCTTVPPFDHTFYRTHIESAGSSILVMASYAFFLQNRVN